MQVKPSSVHLLFVSFGSEDNKRTARRALRSAAAVDGDGHALDCSSPSFGGRYFRVRVTPCRFHDWAVATMIR